MRILESTIVAILLSSTVSAYADIPVYDARTYNEARQTASNTKEILDTNKEVLETVQKTLESVTGQRSQESGQMQNLAVGNGFSVSQMPSFDSVLSGGVPDFGTMADTITQVATVFVNGLKLVKSLSGKDDSGFAEDESYENMLKTVTAISALVNGAQSGVTQRKSALTSASHNIGTAKDIKGSIDQNSQVQVETGLIINEMIGVMTGQLQSQQAENQRKLTDISNTTKALEY
jgi:hypothetical protein